MGKNIHSLALSIQHFKCQPQCHPPSKVPWRMVLELCTYLLYKYTHLFFKLTVSFEFLTDFCYRCNNQLQSDKCYRRRKQKNSNKALTISGITVLLCTFDLPVHQSTTKWSCQDSKELQARVHRCVMTDYNRVWKTNALSHQEKLHMINRRYLYS